MTDSSITTRRRAAPDKDYSIVAVDKFIQATRDSGYKSTACAIAELIDNSIQASASRIEIHLRKAEDGSAHPIEVLVSDDGIGMAPHELRQALRFGGSSRFNDRNGIGRYGMGLPNSSLSQARNVTVHSWPPGSPPHACELDLEEIAAGHMMEIPVPRRVALPSAAIPGRESGTVVRWTDCDRLDQRRISTLERKLGVSLSQQFRYFIWAGVEIAINGRRLQATDPTYLSTESSATGGKQFGQTLEYEVRAADTDDCRETGVVRVTFSELPVSEWHGLPNEEKRRLGVSKGAGVSVVRGMREVDYGWFFMGTKRRENYDDWWRCEIQFEPVLDEAFGLTHTKQQIRPQAHLLEALVPDLEATARALNTRARRAHLAAKSASIHTKAESTLARLDSKLRPLPAEGSQRDRAKIRQLARFDASLQETPAKDSTEYRFVVGRPDSKAAKTSFLDHAYEAGRIVLALNPDHPFYKKIYRRLEESENPADQEMKYFLEVLLLAAAREHARTHGESKKAVTRYWGNVSETLARLLRSK